LAGFNRTHTFNLFYVYQLPFGKGHHYLSSGVVSQVFGGWQIAGTLAKYSGLPFTVGSNTSCVCNGQSQSATQINPNVQILGGHDSLDPYFNGAAFANPATGTLGSTGRNLLTGPGLFNLDANVSRTFGFKSERIKLQIVGEAFNLTNTPSFSNPNATFANPTAPNGVITSYNNYSVITGTVSTQRQLQVAAYVRF